MAELCNLASLLTLHVCSGARLTRALIGLRYFIWLLFAFLSPYVRSTFVVAFFMPDHRDNEDLNCSRFVFVRNSELEHAAEIQTDWAAA